MDNQISSPWQGSVLIANRGEIACRIIRACQALGLRSIAVYSDADADAMHRHLADEAIHIGAAPATESYLDVEKVLAAGRQAGADAVHPGYGFLSENTTFARKAVEVGMRWIGPLPETIEAMGDKDSARFLAKSFGVPVLPGTDRLSEDPATWQAAGESVGYPLLVKAVGGGGGIGMRCVRAPEDLAATILSARSVAQRSFGNPDVYLERYVEPARHIEIQVFGYGDGNAIHLFERECSLQRRFQKVIEESPAPNLDKQALDRMTEAAVSLAKGTNYAGAGTVEFIVDAETQEPYFLEMNTRIQVEHGVTEMITGWDLVQEQIRLAYGRATPARQQEISRSGASIECRIYAEKPEKNFLPSPGLLTQCTFPEPSATLRVDTGFREGDQVTPYYDPMIAKVIARADSRPEAIEEMFKALSLAQIAGVGNNVAFLQTLLRTPEVERGEADTGYIDRNGKALLARMQELKEPA